MTENTSQGILGKEKICSAIKTGAWTLRECKGEAKDRKGKLLNYIDALKTMRVGEHSVDVTLCPILRKITAPLSDGVIDIYDEKSIGYTEHVIDDKNGFILLPDECVLGCIEQAFDHSAPIDGIQYTKTYDGRSTVGRLFLTSHQTAGYCDFGFKGYITLEIRNELNIPLRIYSGMRIGQITFVPVNRKITEVDYSTRGNYQQEECVPCVPKLGRWHF